MMERLVQHPSTWSKMVLGFDAFLGATGITLAVAWPVIENLAQAVAVIAGAALLVVRLLIAFREWRNPKE